MMKDFHFIWINECMKLQGKFLFSSQFCPSCWKYNVSLLYCKIHWFFFPRLSLRFIVWYFPREFFFKIITINCLFFSLVWSTRVKYFPNTMLLLLPNGFINCLMSINNNWITFFHFYNYTQSFKFYNNSVCISCFVFLNQICKITRTYYLENPWKICLVKCWKFTVEEEVACLRECLCLK